MRKTLILLSALFFLTLSAFAQQEIVVPAANSAPATTKIVTTSAISDTEIAEMMRILRAMKVQNDEVLKKQQAAMEALDELQKEADQIRIFSKRG